MRCVDEPGRSLKLLRLAVLATISVAAVSCSSDTQRFQYNLFGSRTQASSGEVTGSVPPQKQAAIQSAPLPPPNVSAPQTRPAVVGTAGPVSSGAARAAHSGWNWEGGTAITVQKGDTIDGLVTRYGVPAAAIAEANNIPNGAALKPGQRLVIPKYEVTGSTTSRAASNAPHSPAPTIGAPATSSSQHVHVISPRQTLLGLSRKYHKPLGAIAKANNIQPHTMVKVGDRIVIPGIAPQAAAKPSVPAPLTQAPKSPSAPNVASVPAAPAAAP